MCYIAEMTELADMQDLSSDAIFSSCAALGLGLM